MCVFKIVGQVVKYLEGGNTHRAYSKTYVQAKNKDHAELKAINLGFVDPEVTFFRNDSAGRCIESA